MRAAIQHLKSARDRNGSHPGLLLQRYVFHPADGSEEWSSEKRALLRAAIRAPTHDEVRALYRLAFDRWTKTVLPDAVFDDLETPKGASRLIVGLGSENVLETGIRLHQTYGMPIIPGSALKGLAAHYCDQVWGPMEKRFTQEGDYHWLVFGTTDDSGCGGFITFHDAWYVPESSPQPLVLDVMTPHHPDYNRDPAKDRKFRAPTDFDSPTPVPFLSVTGAFRVAVSWHGPASDKARKWTELALALLCDALKDWGAGGKTTSGYGRLVVRPPPPPPPPPKKRASGERARVRIIAQRPKGGFDVQDVEPGRNPGTLTLGTPPPGTDTNLEAVVDVLVHVDEERRPQYKWPQAPRK